MSASKGTFGDFDEYSREPSASSSRKVRVEDVLKDLLAGMRTKHFMEKYGLSMPQFEDLIKNLIRQGLLTMDQFKAWKAHRPVPAPPGLEKKQREEPTPQEPERLKDNIETYVLEEPEKNHAWAMKLFSLNREQMRGAQFKALLHGKKYSFVVERLLFRGQVRVTSTVPRRKSQSEMTRKREEAIEYIAKFGWAAYLEARAYEANFDTDTDTDTEEQTARLVLLHCRNETYLAALHTPAPAINLYVSPSLNGLIKRLSRTIDTSQFEGTN